MKVHIYPYDLASPWHGPCHQGALLRVETKKGAIGYSDLHPWPELGDPTLQECFKKGPQLPLWNHALRLAHLDAQWRAMKFSPFKQRRLPLSHYLLPNLDYDTLPKQKSIIWRLEQALQNGFTHIKLKIGRNLRYETTQLRSLMKNFGPQIRWRLDFNGQLDGPTFHHWLQEVADFFQPYVDFIEDPVPLQDLNQVQPLLPIALDRERPTTNEGEPWEQHSPQQSSRILIIKPEIQPLNVDLPPSSLVFTNNLGHPYGHGQALALAALTGCENVGGFQGLLEYQTPLWPEYLLYFGPHTLAPSGLGFGGDDLLRKIKWKSLPHPLILP